MKCKGFTLIELMIVVAIIGILASLVLGYNPEFNQTNQQPETIIINEGDLN